MGRMITCRSCQRERLHAALELCGSCYSVLYRHTHKPAMRYYTTDLRKSAPKPEPESVKPSKSNNRMGVIGLGDGLPARIPGLRQNAVMGELAACRKCGGTIYGDGRPYECLMCGATFWLVREPTAMAVAS